MRIGILIALLILALSAAGAMAATPKPAASGSIEGQIMDEQGNAVIRYAGLVPPKLPSHRLFGLILGLHGKGGDEKQQIGRISKALESNELSGQYMILGLKSKNESWEDGDSEPVAKAIAWAMKEYPIDARRVYAWGFSSGSFFTGKFGPKHPELLAGGVIQCGGIFSVPKTEDDAAEPAFQFYIIHGEKDAMVDVKVSHDSCQHLTDGKYHFVYRELTGDDHGLGGPGGNPARHDAIRYMNAIRNRVIPLSEAEKKIVDEMIAKLTSGKMNPPISAYAPFLNLAGPETDAAVVLMLQSVKPEIRLNGVALCQQRLYGKPVLDALPALLKDKDGKVRTGAIRALGMAADFQRPDAVAALATLAKDTMASLVDRTNAAGQLGLTMTLQLYCVNHDAGIFGVMNDLLEDKNSQIKGLAKVSLDGKLAFDGQRYQVEQ